MIQRKQTIFLLLALAAIIVCLCLPIGRVAPKGIGSVAWWYNLGIYDATRSYVHPLPFIDLVVVGTLSFVDIFLYKKRSLQMKVCVASIVLLLLWYGYYVFMAYTADNFLSRGTFHVCFAVCLPFVAIVFLFLARKGIKADEELIKSMDRIR